MIKNNSIYGPALKSRQKEYNHCVATVPKLLVTPSKEIHACLSN